MGGNCRRCADDRSLSLLLAVVSGGEEEAVEEGEGEGADALPLADGRGGEGVVEGATVAVDNAAADTVGATPAALAIK